MFVASECTPFVKTGGLADVIGSLPQALNQLPTIETNVILPYYEPVMKPWMNKLEELFTIPIEVGWRKHSFTLYQLVHKNVRYYFIKKIIITSLVMRFMVMKMMENALFFLVKLSRKL